MRDPSPDQVRDRERRFDDLTFEGYRRRALDPTLSAHEKVGFPDEYRAGREEAILADLLAKLPNLAAREQRVLDIGPGCGPLAHLLLAHAEHQGHHLTLVDSEEMLSQLPPQRRERRIAGRFPEDCAELLARESGSFDVVLAYSLLHHVFVEASVHGFVDAAASLLAEGGELLLGDIPNVSMRDRFFSSSAGRRAHVESGRQGEPPLRGAGPIPGRIDDAVVLGLLARTRSAGFHAFCLPQPAALPLASRREDVLVRRP